MGISGSLEDVSVADVMQFIHLGQRTGTLVLERAGAQAKIAFHHGQLVSAHVPGKPKLGELLVSSGLVEAAVLESAIELQRSEDVHRSLGRILVDQGEVDPEKLRQAVVGQIERNVSEAVTWTRGSFEFVVDDLRPVDDIALYPGDVIPDSDINTQMVLLEAARIFDERSREGEESPRHPWPRQVPDDIGVPPVRPPHTVQAPGGVPHLPAAAAEQVSRAAALTLLEPELLEGVIEDLGSAAALDPRRLRLEIVSRDETFVHRFQKALPDEIPRLWQVSLEDAGLVVPRRGLTIAVIDLRDGSISLGQVRALHQSQPGVAILILLEPGASVARAYAAGARAALPAEVEAVVACIDNLLEDYTGAPGAQGPSGGGKAGVARLRRVFGDLRSGLISATVALNLMHIISESVERAVLFLARRDRLVALGAFGSGAGGRPLAELTRGLEVDPEGDNALTWSLEVGEARSLRFDAAALPRRFVELVGRPANGPIVVFPVLGSQRVIAIIYTDNGDRTEEIEDIEILELATAQVGMAFENELLRRQISQQL